jgi:hypothetical protein
MEIDLINVASTFGAAIAGSWFGARATNKQTLANIKLEEAKWRKERSFELLDQIDEFVNYSFRVNTLTLPERDRLSRKLLTLAAIVIQQEAKVVSTWISEI